MKKILLGSAVFMICLLFIGCNNLQWSEKATYSMNWDKAKQYCENLDEGGHNDWRLPNIDELRTLIKAPETISGGKCQISEKVGKLAREDFTEDCNSLTSKLGDTDGFWSSSVYSNNSDYAWNVNFNIGTVDNNSKNRPGSVRCVR